MESLTITLTIKTGNAAFAGDDLAFQVADIIEQAVKRTKETVSSMSHDRRTNDYEPLHDHNGNHVGRVTILSDPGESPELIALRDLVNAVSIRELKLNVKKHFSLLNAHAQATKTIIEARRR